MASSSTTISISRSHLYLLSIASRIFILCLVYISSFLPVFDSGVNVVLSPSTNRLTSALLRWDTFHFAHIAKEGYVYEYEWAFFPGITMTMRYAGQATGLLKHFLGIEGDGTVNILQGAAILAMLCDSTVALYDLSLEVFASERIARLAALLSLIPSSPAALRYAPYTEPFFTYLSYKGEGKEGMLASMKSQYLEAAVFFALASTFRSNGILLAGYIVWPLVVQPLLQRAIPRRATVYYAFSLSIFIGLPLILYQASAYRLFCSSSSRPSWCSNFPPSIYTYVQAAYWDVGFLRYWQLSQIPNFLMAAPVYVLLSSFYWFHLSRWISDMLASLQRTESVTRVPKVSSDPFLSPKLTPFVIHALILTSTLLVSSHAQIILRLAASMPVVYWAAAWLLIRDNATRPPGQCGWHWGRVWVWWSVVWGSASVVLWTTGLPPA
ncbi:glycosyltransferase family 76 protein [Neolentinus lepideus HHB14362 ss-1]|uniref:GPI mannosyltransferase 2 n=1 Tax=Neolentinus lepideus HHB14362 ss-1 TaxID=1314782 RepID=A0A165RWY7_9AGAM|nr:glycosyltransferase family 76 protein [Neolentinus lepideus HHB14362 ss-1]